MGSSESAAWTTYDSAVATAAVAWVQTVAAADEAFQNTAIAQIGAEATAATGAITALAFIDTAWISQVAGAEVLWRTAEAAAEVNRIAAIGTAATAAEQRLGTAAETWAQATWPAWATFVADVSQADADRQQEIALAAADHEKTAAAAHVPYVQKVTAAAVIHAISAAEAEGTYHVVMVGLQVDRAVAGAKLNVAYVNAQDPASFAWIEPNGGLDYEGPASSGDDAWLDQLKTMSDTAGLIDPTIFSDGVSTLISLYQGNYGEAVLSVLAMPPGIGVIARGGRYVSVPQSVLQSVRTNAQLIQEVATRADRWGVRKGLASTGSVPGTLKHGYADRLMTRYQRMFGDRGLNTEVRYLNGQPWQPGMLTKDSIRLDVVEGPVTAPTRVFDYKFGGATLIPPRVGQIRAGAGLGPEVPVIEVKP